MPAPRVGASCSDSCSGRTSQGVPAAIISRNTIPCGTLTIMEPEATGAVPRRPDFASAIETDQKAPVLSADATNVA